VFVLFVGQKLFARDALQLEETEMGRVVENRVLVEEPDELNDIALLEQLQNLFEDVRSVEENLSFVAADQSLSIGTRDFQLERVNIVDGQTALIGFHFFRQLVRVCRVGIIEASKCLFDGVGQIVE